MKQCQALFHVGRSWIAWGLPLLRAIDLAAIHRGRELSERRPEAM
ncbi:MAG TPA: hypothetical protein VNT32_13425 [Thermoleophilaceae bacterium]|nr:hypothetical protein [Thermoleophilaceae bacterium]